MIKMANVSEGFRNSKAARELRSTVLQGRIRVSGFHTSVMDSGQSVIGCRPGAC